MEETRSGVNAKLEIWLLEFEGFWLSGTKTEYIVNLVEVEAKTKRW